MKKRIDIIKRIDENWMNVDYMTLNENGRYYTFASYKGSREHFIKDFSDEINTKILFHGMKLEVGYSVIVDVPY